MTNPAPGGRLGLALDALRSMSGALVYAVAQTAALAAVTRLGGEQDAADWFLAQALATPVAFFTGLRMKEQLAVDGEAGAFVHRIGRSLALSAVLGLIVTTGWVVFASGQLRTVGIAYLWANFGQQSVGAYQGRAAQRSNFFWPSQLDALLGVTALAAVLIGYERDGLATAAVLTAMLWWLIAAVPLLHDIWQGRHGEHTRSTVPVSHELAVGTSALAQNSQISVARVGARSFAGESALNAIGTASFLVRTGVIAMVGLRAAIGPRLAEATRAGTLDRLAVRMRRVIWAGSLAGAVVGSAIGYAIGPPVLEAVFGEDVIPTRATMAIVLLGATLLYGSMLLGQLALALNRRPLLARATIGGLIGTALTIAPLGLYWGEEGAALALSIGYGTRFFLVDRAVGSERTPWLRSTPMAVAAAAALAVLLPSGLIIYSITRPASDPPDGPIDAIVVLSGGRGERFDRAIEIADEHPDASLAFSVPPHEPKHDFDVEVREFCATSPDPDVSCFVIDVDSTAGEAAIASDIITVEGWNDVVVVTSDFHAARAARWFSRCGADVEVVGATTDFADERIPREFAATVAALTIDRSCPR